jgi:hypothetical protein
MGWVWNILLACSSEEFAVGRDGATKETCEPLERINRWIPHGKLVSLVGPTYAKGVGSGMNAYLFGGGFKHFDIEDFVRVVEVQAWKDRANLQLWVRGDADGPFTAVRLRPKRAPAQTAEAKSGGSGGPLSRERAQGRNRKARG